MTQTPPPVPALSPPSPSRPEPPPRRASSLVICDEGGAHLFSGDSLLGVQLGGLRVAPRRRAGGPRDEPPAGRPTHV